MEKLMPLMGSVVHFHCKLSGYRGLLEAEIWYFPVAQQGYLGVGVGSPVLKQVAAGYRAMGICNTD